MNLEDAATVGPTLAGGFAAAKAAAVADPTLGATPAERVVGAYHGSLVPPFCNVAVRTFFGACWRRACKLSQTALAFSGKPYLNGPSGPFFICRLSPLFRLEPISVGSG